MNCWKILKLVILQRSAKAQARKLKNAPNLCTCFTKILHISRINKGGHKNGQSAAKRQNGMENNGRM